MVKLTNLIQKINNTKNKEKSYAANTINNTKKVYFQEWLELFFIIIQKN